MWTSREMRVFAATMSLLCLIAATACARKSDETADSRQRIWSLGSGIPEGRWVGALQPEERLEARVELVGVYGFSGESRKWWRPEGTKFDESPLSGSLPDLSPGMMEHLASLKGMKPYRFLFIVHSPPGFLNLVSRYGASSQGGSGTAGHSDNQRPGAFWDFEAAPAPGYWAREKLTPSEGHSPEGKILGPAGVEVFIVTIIANEGMEKIDLRFGISRPVALPGEDSTVRFVGTHEFIVFKNVSLELGEFSSPEVEREIRVCPISRFMLQWPDFVEDSCDFVFRERVGGASS